MRWIAGFLAGVFLHFLLFPTLGLAACERGSTSEGAAPMPSAATASNVAAVVGGAQKHYDLAFTADPCSADKDCTAHVTLAIKDGFHVNDAYPYRFVATVAPGGPEFLGKDGAGPHVFSKAAGDFTQAGPTHASIAVRFSSAQW